MISCEQEDARIERDVSWKETDGKEGREVVEEEDVGEE